MFYRSWSPLGSVPLRKFGTQGAINRYRRKLLFWCDHLSGRLSRYGALPPCGSQSSVRRLPACHFGNGALPLSVSSTLECPLAFLSGTAQQSTGLPRGQALSASGGQLRQRRSQFQVRLRGPALCLLMALQRNIKQRGNQQVDAATFPALACGMASVYGNRPAQCRISSPKFVAFRCLLPLGGSVIGPKIRRNSLLVYKNNGQRTT